jgi:ferritin
LLEIACRRKAAKVGSGSIARKGDAPANQKIVAAINDQMGNEFSAMLQYYAIAAHFGAEGLRELTAHFYKQAEEEKEHALRFIQFVITSLFSPRSGRTRTH